MNALSVARQGIGKSPLSVALQGFFAESDVFYEGDDEGGGGGERTRSRSQVSPRAVYFPGWQAEPEPIGGGQGQGFSAETQATITAAIARADALFNASRIDGTALQSSPEPVASVFTSPMAVTVVTPVASAATRRMDDEEALMMIFMELA